MKYLVISAVLCLHFIICLTTEVRLASSPSVQVCPGDAVTFVCNITQTATHLWTISSTIVTNAVVSSGLALPSITGFEFSADNTPDGLVTTVQFRVTMSHTATCINAGNFNIREETNITLLGGLFVPVVTTVQNNISSLNLTIIQPGESAICVQNYNITVTSMDFTIQQSVIHARNSSPTTVVIDNLQFCIYNYTLQVVAIALNGSMSEPVVHMENFTSGDDLFIPMVSIIQNTISSLYLTITQPGESAMCVRNYNITVTSVGYVTQQSVVDAMNSLPTYVMIDNLRLCTNYTFEVHAIALGGTMSEPSVDIGNITPRRNLHLSNFIFERRVVRWSVPPELMDCIAGYEYSFQYSGVSGLLPANTTMLLLDILNISTPCNVDYLTVSPMYHVPPQPIKKNSIMGCISTDIVPLTTGIFETTQQQATTQAYVGGIIGISVVAIVIGLILLIIIAALAVKVKKLQLQLQDLSKPDVKNIDAQYDEVTLEKHQNKHSLNTKSDHTSKGKCEMNMVDCLAYGTVSESSRPQGASTTETGVYEAV